MDDRGGQEVLSSVAGAAPRAWWHLARDGLGTLTSRLVELLPIDALLAPRGEREHLRQSQRELSDFLENAVVGLHWMGPDGRILWANQAEIDLLGYTGEEYVGRHIAQFHAERAVIDDILQRLNAGETISNREAQLRCKDGSLKHVLISSNVLWEDGRFVHTRCVTRDVTRLKQAEEERALALAREQAARAEADAVARRSAFLAEATKVLAASLDYETTLQTLARLAVSHVAEWCLVDVLEADQSVRRMAVAHADAIKERLLADLEPVNALAPPGGAVARVLQSGRPETLTDITEAIPETDAGDAEQLAMLRALGDKPAMVVPLIARGRTLGAVTLASSDAVGHYGPDTMGLVEDFARRAALAVDNARLYHEAQEANRLKDEFLGIVSHELRTPLTAIFAWVRLLRTKRLDEARWARALATIERNAKAQAQVVDDLLDVSRIVSGKLRVNVKPVDLAPTVEAAVDAVRPEADARAISLVAVLEPEAGFVLGDAMRLQQVVWNLLTNAIKFTPKEGRIEVRLERRTGHAEIRVSDTGKGISADFLPFVFDRFRQADSTSTRLHSGLGVGLAIVRHLVELHGGTVRAESAGHGKGATFSVKLPLMAVSTGAKYSARRSPSTSNGARHRLASLDGVRVLAVDDDADTREFLSTVLEECGAQVTAVGSVGQAIEAYERLVPDVLLGDIAMPGEDGYALIRKVRSLDQARGGWLPAIALTACAGTEDRMRALRAGYQLHLPKPFEPADLVTVVANLAGRTGTS